MKNDLVEHVTSTAAQAVISKAPYVGATVTIIGGYSLNEWLAIVGIIFTTLTFFLNWHMQRQRLKLMREEAEKQRERWSESESNSE